MEVCNKESDVEQQANVEALRANYELVMKERDEAQRLCARTQQELDSVVRCFQDLTSQHDQPLEHNNAENIANRAHQPSFRDMNNVNQYQPSTVPVVANNESHRTHDSTRRHWDRQQQQQGDYNSRTEQPIENSWPDEGVEKVVYETSTVQLTRVPNYGFGIAVSGGRDNPHYANGDPAVVVSDVLKNGPAVGKLLLNDIILSVNGYSLDNVDHATAISVLKDSGQMATLVIRRKATVTSNGDFEQPFKVTLNKKNKKDDYGVVLGYKLYIKELTPNGLASLDGNLKEGDTLVKLNGTAVENLSLAEARKQIDKCKDKLQLVVARSAGQRKKYAAPPPPSFTEPVVAAVKSPSEVSSPPRGLSTTNGRGGDTTAAAVAPQTPSTMERRPTQNGPAYDPLFAADQRPTYDVPPTRPPLPTQPVPVEVRPYGPLPPVSADYTNGPPGGHIYGPMYPPAGVPSTGDVERGPLKFRSEPRLISFRKEGGVGIRISGGNRTGIFVAKVAPHTPAEQRGLREGDMILKVNDVDMFGKTREEAVLLLLGLRDQVTLLVQYRQHEYDRLMADGGTGDYFCVRMHFDYSATEHGEMAFKRGDIFLVTDTLYGGVVGSWQASHIVRTPSHEAKKGIIPNLSRAQQLALAQYSDKENLPGDANKAGGDTGSSGGSSFFKKKNAMRTKSLGKDHWDSAVFGAADRGSLASSKQTGHHLTKFPAYERVVLREPGFIRPVVIFGPLADVARDKLVADLPDRYELPKSEISGDGNRASRSGIIKLSAIRDVVDKRRHCVLDVTPNAVDRLNYAQYVPIVVYLRAENKHAVKEQRHHWARQSGKSHRKLFEQATRLEKLCSHLFTFTIPLTNGDAWLRKLKEAIEKSQSERVWMSENKPEFSRDDLHFSLMGHRLSFISSPESDYDIAGPSDYNEPTDVPTSPCSAVPTTTTSPWQQRHMRASSDPSIIATLDNVVSVPVEVVQSSPAVPPMDNVPRYAVDPRYARQQPPAAAPASPSRPTYYARRDPAGINDMNGRSPDRYYRPAPNYDQGSAARHRPNRNDPYYRMAIDPYVTLTPSERARLRQADPAHRYYNPEYPSASTAAYMSGRPAPSPQRDQRGPSPGPMIRGRSAGDLVRSGYPPVAAGMVPPGAESMYYSYRPERPPYASYDRREDDLRPTYKPDIYGHYPQPTIDPINKHDDSKLQEMFGTAVPLSGGPGSAVSSRPGERYMSNGEPPQHWTQPERSFTTRGVDASATVFRPDDRQGSSGPVSGVGAPVDYLFMDPAERENLKTRHPEPSVLGGDPARSAYSAPPPASQSAYPAPGPTASQPYQSNTRTFVAELRGEPDSDRIKAPYSRGFPETSAASRPADIQQRGGGAAVTQAGPQRSLEATAVTQSGPHSRPATQSQPTSQSRSNAEPLPQHSMPSNDLYARPYANGRHGSGNADFAADDRVNSFANREPKDNCSVPTEPPRGSAFESYKKPSSLNASQTELDRTSTADRQQREGSIDSDESHSVVATARGVFDSKGGILESKETGVSIVIPAGAIPDAVQQEIYFKVCQDNSIMPPLDKEKGETLLSPLVMCGPHGLKFLKPVELRLPHRASVNPDSWSFALKSSDSPTGHPSHWQNMTLAGSDGVAQGRVGKTSVSVLVDHF